MVSKGKLTRKHLFLCILLLPLQACSFSVRVIGWVFDKETGLPIEGTTVNLLEGGDIQKTASNGLFQVFSETGPFQDPILQISKPGYKPFHLQIERNKEETRYMIKSEQVFVEYDTPVYPDLNNRKTFSAGTWINKWSQDFKNGDTLSIYLEREDIKTEVDRLVRKQNTFNR